MKESTGSDVEKEDRGEKEQRQKTVGGRERRIKQKN